MRKHGNASVSAFPRFLVSIQSEAKGEAKTGFSPGRYAEMLLYRKDRKAGISVFPS